MCWTGWDVWIGGIGGVGVFDGGFCIYRIGIGIGTRHFGLRLQLEI